MLGSLVPREKVISTWHLSKYHWQSNLRWRSSKWRVRCLTWNQSLQVSSLLKPQTYILLPYTLIKACTSSAWTASQLFNKRTMEERSLCFTGLQLALKLATNTICKACLLGKRERRTACLKSRQLKYPLLTFNLLFKRASFTKAVLEAHQSISHQAWQV